MSTTQTDIFLPLAGIAARAVPERPTDDGLFGPRSLAWRVHRDRSFPIAGLRSLLLQSLHPLAMAGVADHSSWQQDPLGRLAATSGYVLTVTYGNRSDALGFADAVRRIHARVHGVDRVTGLPYSAEDPALLLWVHIAMVDSIVAVVRRYGTGLENEDAANRYVAEMVTFAEIVGVPRPLIPTTVDELAEAVAATPHLQATPAAREAMAIVLEPPGLDADIGDLWRDLGRVAVGSLPEWARSMHGYPEPAAAQLERLPVRQLLGVLDVYTLAQPGVREARERIERRLRA